MKVGVISDGPLLTTGYGIPTGILSRRFHEMGMDVACLGIHQVAVGRHENPLPYRVWPVCPHDPNGLELMGPFLHAEAPDVLLMINTLQVCNDWCARVRRAHQSKAPIVVYYTIEGAPLDPDWFSCFRFIQGATAFTRFTRDSVKKEFNVDTEFTYMGVDHKIFFPYEDSVRRRLRQAVGWDDRFVVMYVGRNMGSKQQDKVIEAAAILKSKGYKDVLFYLHCAPFENYENGGWDLRYLSRLWGVEDLICFPPDLVDQKLGPPHGNSLEGWNPSSDPIANLASLGLAARYNCADFYIHPSMVEGFSFPCAESMASGLPMAHTDDGGVMNEVCGEAGVRIPRAVELTASWGARYSVLSAEAIAETVEKHRKLFSESPESRREMSEASVKQASQYTWDQTAAAVHALLEKAAAKRIK